MHRIRVQIAFDRTAQHMKQGLRCACVHRQFASFDQVAGPLTAGGPLLNKGKALLPVL